MLFVKSAPYEHQIDAGDAAEDRRADKAVQQRREEKHDKIDDREDRQPRTELGAQKGADILCLCFIIIP